MTHPLTGIYQVALHVSTTSTLHYLPSSSNYSVFECLVSLLFTVCGMLCYCYCMQLNIKKVEVEVVIYSIQALGLELILVFRHLGHKID